MSGQRELWTLAFLAGLMSGMATEDAEEQADLALVIYNDRWPDGEEAGDGG